MTWALAIHGGAGLIRRDALSAEREAACRVGLHDALDLGRGILADGGSALDAVEQTTRFLEDCPVFNAGRGSVIAGDGTVELDAAIMDGRDRNVGAVASVKTPKNPVSLARAVMERTPHVMLVGTGADALAAELGLETADLAWFVTPERVAQYEKVAGTEHFHLDHGSDDRDVYGTVGAVAIDAAGHLAAASSTGGMVNKRPGRVGDTPIPGAGTYAWDRTCAVAGTGHGEPFIRLGVGQRISAWMELGGLSLAEAVDRVVHHELVALGGAGGVVAVGADGAIAMPFNTAGMFRGAADADGRFEVGIW